MYDSLQPADDGVVNNVYVYPTPAHRFCTRVVLAFHRQKFRAGSPIAVPGVDLARAIRASYKILWAPLKSVASRISGTLVAGTAMRQGAGAPCRLGARGNVDGALAVRTLDRGLRTASFIRVDGVECASVVFANA